MADKSAIEWTDATWNPIVGCSIISPGCTNCYAMKMAARIEHMRAPERRGDAILPHHYTALTAPSKAGPVWTGRVNIAPDHILTQPLRWKRGRRIFVNSMGDLFHESIPDEWIDRVFAVMALCPQHTFQVLTKRAERMRDYFAAGFARMNNAAFRLWLELGRPSVHVPDWPLPNVWLGVSTERQQEADERIPLLLQTPAAVRFISAEPLLGPIDLRDLDCGNGIRWNSLGGRGRKDGLDWVIVGGESGPGARPMSIQWARELRDQCGASQVPFFFKQWGCWAPAGFHRSEQPGRFAFGDYEHDRSAMIEVDHYPRQFTKFGARSVMQWAGKKAAGRLLDGREHNEFPEART